MTEASTNISDGLRPPDGRLDALCPWVFYQLWYPHRLKKPTQNYTLTIWNDDWDPKSQERPVAGRDFFLNEKFMCGQPHWISFPERDCFKDNREYQSLRHSWILIERSYPMVPCAENTPLPNRKQSKQQRAKLFSVYLRPWTLLASEATSSKPYVERFFFLRRQEHRTGVQTTISGGRLDLHSRRLEMRGFHPGSINAQCGNSTMGFLNAQNPQARAQRTAN